MATFDFLKRILGTAQTVHEYEYLKAVSNQEYAGNPTNNVVPDFIGQICVDTTNTHAYVALTAASSGWARID